MAIARVLMNDTARLLAYEPMGNIDSHTGAAFWELPDELHAADSRS